MIWLFWSWLGEGSAASTSRPSQGPAGKPRHIIPMAEPEFKRASGNTQGLLNPGLETDTPSLLPHSMGQNKSCGQVKRQRGTPCPQYAMAKGWRHAANLPFGDRLKLKGLYSKS